MQKRKRNDWTHRATEAMPCTYTRIHKHCKKKLWFGYADGQANLATSVSDFRLGSVFGGKQSPFYSFKSQKLRNLSVLVDTYNPFHSKPAIHCAI